MNLKWIEAIMEHMEHNLSKYNILTASQCFKDWLLGSNSAIRPPIATTIWCQKFINLKVGSFFWCNLKVGKLFAGPKIILLEFYENFFGEILKLAHYSFQTILRKKDFFSIFCQMFWCQKFRQL